MIAYTPQLDIRNVAALPRGTGAKYLRCLRAHDGTLIAKSWHHKAPQLTTGEVLVRFGGAK